MKTSSKIIAGIALLLVVVAGVYWFTTRDDGPVGDTGAPVAINSFEDCVAAGNPILESYPEQCIAPDGRTFTRVLPPAEDQPSTSDDFPADIATDIERKRDLIFVTEPAPLTTVNFPLTIRGEARGTWYFEATFPVRVEDEDGNVLVESYATALSDWMTEEFVAFETELEFDNPNTGNIFLVLEKSNPSGLPEQEDELRIPLRSNTSDL